MRSEPRSERSDAVLIRRTGLAILLNNPLNSEFFPVARYSESEYIVHSPGGLSFTLTPDKIRLHVPDSVDCSGEPKKTPALYAQVQSAAVRAARRAGEVIRRAAGRVDSKAVRAKGLHDLVTDVDREAEAIIVDCLKTEFPDHLILAEESFSCTSEQDTKQDSSGQAGVQQDHMAEFEKHDHLWIIDPIDGTTNFMHGVAPYAVSIAFRHKGKLTVGVVYDVAHDELFTAITGCGVFHNGSRACVSTTQALSESLVTTGFPYRAYGHIDQYMSVLRRFMKTTHGVRRPGSAAVDLAWIAVGRFDAFFETGLMPWDVAAGVVLVREGGGHISDYRGNPEPSFTAQIVATNGLVHDEVLDFVSPMKDVYE